MSATALAMVLTPGPNMFYLVSRSVAQGRVAGMISLAGTAVGFVVYLALANVGLAVVFIAVPWLFMGVKAAGAIYLAYLAWQALRPGGHGLFTSVGLPRDSAGTLFRMGLLTNLLNPKTAIMYLALIPQFVDPSRGHPAAQGFVLGGIQITVSLLVNAMIVAVTGGIAVLLARRPAWAQWQRRVTGCLLGAVAVLLAREVPARVHG